MVVIDLLEVNLTLRDKKRLSAQVAGTSIVAI